MGRYLRLLGLFIRVSIQDDAAYRFDFFVQIVGAVLHAAALLLGLAVIFDNTTDLNGWGPYHMLTLLGVFRIMSGVIAMIIAPNMRRIMEDVRGGTLDFVLLKPINSQFMASARRIAIFRIADVAVGAVLAGIGAGALTQQVSAGPLAAFVAMLAAGSVIIYSFWLILATLSFWLVRVQNLEMVFWNVFEAGRYPVSIYGPQVRWILTYVIPVAFVVTFPAQALVGGAGDGVDVLGPAAWVAAVVVAPGMLVAASLFWRYGLRYYSGASA